MVDPTDSWAFLVGWGEAERWPNKSVVLTLLRASARSLVIIFIVLVVVVANIWVILASSLTTLK